MKFNLFSGTVTIYPFTKRFLVPGLLIFIAAGLFPQDFRPPALSGRVNDYAGILSARTEEDLTRKLADLEASDSTQFAVLTVPSLQGLEIEEFAIETAEAWKLGTKENDNGGILVIAPSERKIRIEAGYGLEGVLTDIRAGRIIDSVIAPEFRLNRYDEGVSKGIDAIISTVRGEYTGRGFVAATQDGEDDGGGSFFPFVILFFILVIFGSRKKILGGLGGAILLPLFAWFLFPISLPFILFLIPGGFVLGLVLSLIRFFPLAGSGYRRRGWFGGHQSTGFGIFGGRHNAGGSRTFGGRSGGGWGGFSGGGGGFGGGGASGSW